MQKLFKWLYQALPFILLTSYLIYSSLESGRVTFANAWIVTVLTALVGFKYWLNQKELPDIRGEVAEAFKNRDEKLEKIENEINQLGVISKKVFSGDKTNFRF